MWTPWWNPDEQHSFFIPNFEDELQQEENFKPITDIFFWTATITPLRPIEDLGSPNFGNFLGHPSLIQEGTNQ